MEYSIKFNSKCKACLDLLLSTLKSIAKKDLVFWKEKDECFLILIKTEYTEKIIQKIIKESQPINHEIKVKEVQELKFKKLKENYKKYTKHLWP